MRMRPKSNLYQLGLILLMGILVRSAPDRDCDYELWDDSPNGKGVRRLDFECEAGHIDWHAPYGGLIINLKGPATEYQLCLQIVTYHVTAVLSQLSANDSPPLRLLTLNQAKDDEKRQTYSLCFPAHNTVQLLVEPEVSPRISSQIKIDYDIEKSPRYGEEACRPCTDEELIYHYCASDFVAIGGMLDLKQTAASNIITVGLDYVKQQALKYFTKDALRPSKLTGIIYTPPQCRMEHGTETFVFMGKLIFNKAHLRCAPTYNDFQELQRTSRLKGTSLCT